MEDLRKDYKRGLVVAISFCVFVMPLLVPRMEETNNNNQSGVEEVGKKNFNDELKVYYEYTKSIVDNTVDTFMEAHGLKYVMSPSKIESY